MYFMLVGNSLTNGVVEVHQMMVQNLILVGKCA